MDVEHNKIVDYFMYVQTMVKRITEKLIKNKLVLDKKIILCENLIVLKDLIVLREIKDSVFFLNLLNCFIKKNIKNKEIISKEKINNKLSDININRNLKIFTYTKFTNWIFQ